jgi:hypothetical protein
MRLNGSIEQTSLKCSGVCICTGTGSTSWHLSINRLPAQSVAELLKLVDVHSSEDREVLAAQIADVYNRDLIFRAGKVDNRIKNEAFHVSFQTINV